jgi:hypothetical protein
VPQRTEPQHIAALRKGLVIRRARADLKRDLTSGQIDIANILRHPPQFAENMPIDQLLKALPKYGTCRVNNLLNRHHITTNRKLADLTKRQRLAIVKGLS